jgi:hypothetical protein
MAQIGQPIRRYTVIPLEETVSPTHEPVNPPPRFRRKHRLTTQSQSR